MAVLEAGIRFRELEVSGGYWHGDRGSIKREKICYLFGPILKPGVVSPRTKMIGFCKYISWCLPIKISSCVALFYPIMISCSTLAAKCTQNVISRFVSQIASFKEIMANALIIGSSILKPANV